MKNKIMRELKGRSKYWSTMVDMLDREFPKGSSERGRAMVMLAHMDMMLRGWEFEDGEPIKEPKERSRIYGNN